MKTYQITVTEEQARVLQSAAELLARLGIFQLWAVVEHLPDVFQRCYEVKHGLSDLLRAEGDKLTRLYSVIPADKKPNRNPWHISWDLYQVIRHRLAHDELQPGEEPRYWSVMYNEPFQTADCPLAKIEEVAD